MIPYKKYEKLYENLNDLTELYSKLVEIAKSFEQTLGVEDVSTTNIMVAIGKINELILRYNPSGAEDLPVIGTETDRQGQLQDLEGGVQTQGQFQEQIQGQFQEQPLQQQPVQPLQQQPLQQQPLQDESQLGLQEEQQLGLQEEQQQQQLQL